MAKESKQKKDSKIFSGLSLTSPVVLVFVLFAVVSSFTIGTLWTKVRYLEGSQSPPTNNDQVLGEDVKIDPSDDAVVDTNQVPDITEREHVKGNRNAKIALVEYSDYDCPFCQRFHPTAQQMLDEYGDQVMWIYRHFPLDSLHPNARTKSIASECVYEQGGNDAFWNFTDRLYDPSGPVSVDDMPGIVTTLGLDSNAFETCLSAREVDRYVETHIQVGTEAGVRGTPGNFIVNFESNEVVELRGAVPFETLKQTIDSLL